MPVWFRLLISLMFLVLIWLAMDDITTGTEPDYLGEYATVVVCALFVVLLWIGKTGLPQRFFTRK